MYYSIGSARYVAYGNSTSFNFGYLNQNTAAGAWNYVGEATIRPLSDYGYTEVLCSGVGVETAGPYRYTGADAVRVYF